MGNHGCPHLNLHMWICFRDFACRKQITACSILVPCLYGQLLLKSMEAGWAANSTANQESEKKKYCACALACWWAHPHTPALQKKRRPGQVSRVLSRDQGWIMLRAYACRIRHAYGREALKEMYTQKMTYYVNQIFVLNTFVSIFFCSISIQIYIEKIQKTCIFHTDHRA
ncbi:hypothetical protein GDO78_010677 [Eleutherodactylus coqui]|uniref:Uncharacterized protein n=1 Tax=Eleutherodactylus coqui TaxID=57060 RepID=A0A8J6K5H0_ELECQ|nr:hypothetical protein GDO78_010677 [Eleutherodactylus coqui]